MSLPWLELPSLSLAAAPTTAAAVSQPSAATLENQLSNASATPSARCYLLEIPVELRLQIYQFVWDRPAEGVIHCHAHSPEEWQISTHDSNHFSRTKSAELLRTCLLIHNEACSVLYNQTTFCLHPRIELAWKSRLMVPTARQQYCVRHVLIDIELDHIYYTTVQVDKMCALLAMLVQRRSPPTIRAADSSNDVFGPPRLPNLELTMRNRGVDLESGTLAAKVWGAVLREAARVDEMKRARAELRVVGGGL
ncbi:hypothetical protein LTR09_005192 [Extremus antarcticus]|uniref:Uncharacterized protein n=1 Tax=Extremus antarcticus TaxID=702011 RepID=A0AAJ0DH33_9PEZI|nr:hypothetical protein LTR09_005192 [Extremus antarcticus]